MSLIEGQPRVELLGTYPVPEHAGVYLVEAVVHAPPAAVDVGEFCQEDPILPPEEWQGACQEHYLSDDGTQVIGTYLNPPEGGTTTRLAFFLPRCDLDQPLFTPGGPLPLPEPAPMPERLSERVFYEPVVE